MNQGKHSTGPSDSYGWLLKEQILERPVRIFTIFPIICQQILYLALSLKFLTEFNCKRKQNLPFATFLIQIEKCLLGIFEVVDLVDETITFLPENKPNLWADYCRFGSQTGSFCAFKNSMVITELFHTSSGAIDYYRRVSGQLLQLVFA